MEARPVKATLGMPCQLTAIVTILVGRWVDWAMLSQADRFLCLNKILCCMLSGARNGAIPPFGFSR